MRSALFLVAVSLFTAFSLSAQVTPGALARLSPLPITAELLSRYDIAQGKYKDMGADEKAALQKALTYAEAQRLGRIAQLKQIAPEDWPQYVDSKGWLTQKGLDLLKGKAPQASSGTLSVPILQDFQRKDGAPLTERDLARAHLALDQMFDGVARHVESSSFGQDMVFDVRFRNETLYSMTATNPKSGWTYEVGQLGVDGRHPLLAPSWYGNVTKKIESDPDSWVDYRVHAQVGLVNLKARFFTDGPDPSVARTISLIKGLGVPSGKVDMVAQHLAYEDPYRAHNIIVASLLSELGRAYNLFGPVDVGWTATNLTKVAFLAPNTAFDETAGVRVRLSDQAYMGIFAGTTQNISPIGNHLLQEGLATETIKPGLNVENAPHITAAAWGRMPAVSDLYFKVSATQRYNNDTTATQGEVSLIKSISGRPLTLTGSYSREKGKSIEYDRRKLRAELDFQLTPAGSSTRAEAYVAYEQERIKYGNAEVNSDAFIAGFDVNFGGSNGTITMDHVFGGQYLGKSPLNPEFEAITRRINQGVVAGLKVAEDANKLYGDLRAGSSNGQIELRLNDLSYSLGRLEPEASGLLLDEMAKMSLSDAQKQYLSHLLLKTVAAGTDRYNALQASLAGALAGRNLDTEAFWLETRALSAINGIGGGQLSAAQRDQLRAYLDKIRAGIQGNSLSPGDLSAYQNQVTALLGTIGGRSITPADIGRLQSAVAAYVQQLNGVIAIPLGRDGQRILKNIDNASHFLREHQGEIEELAGLLTNPRVWDAVTVQAGRSALMEALNKMGKITIPLKYGSFSFRVDAPVILAASNILESRLSPVAPVRQGDIQPFLLRQAGAALGLSGNVSEDMVVNRLFGMADDQFKAALRGKISSQLDPLLAKYNPADAAQKIFAAVPPDVIDSLKQRYGVNLENLLPPKGATPDQVKDILLNRVPDELTAFVQKQIGAEMARTLAAVTNWAGDIIRREINMTLLQLMLASEELNRLSVDQGLKAGDLGVAMMMSSFEKLDKRTRSEAGLQLHDTIGVLAQETAANDIELGDKFKAQGKARLEAIQLDPAWPRGLEIEFAESSWMPILASYGDGNVFDLIGKIKKRYQAMKNPRPMLVEFEFDQEGFGFGAGATIRETKTGIRYQLPPVKDSDPVFLLSGLESDLPEK